MNLKLKLIRKYQYLIELDLKGTLYLNRFFDKDDFVEIKKVTDKAIDMVSIDNEDDDEINGAWGSVESFEKSELSENSESLDYAAMTDDELIDYYNNINAEVIELDYRAPYQLINYIYDYGVKESGLVVSGKLFYELDIWGDDSNINKNMKTLIVDFEIEFDTTNADSGQIDILNTTVNANMNNHISCNQPLTAIVNDISLIPFNSNTILPKNIKLIDISKKDAFNFNDLQYTDYALKPKPQTSAGNLH